jgi:hypothetical protein
MNNKIPEKLCVPLIIKETYGIERMQEPVSIGIPFPKGKIDDRSLLCILDEYDRSVPFAATVLDTWSDRSFRWVLFDLQISLAPYKETTFFLKTSEGCNTSICCPAESIEVEENETEFIIKTGKTDFCVDRLRFSPFKWVAGKTPNTSVLDKSRLVLTDEKSVQWEAHVDRSLVESSNNFKIILYFEGCFKDDDLASYSGLHFQSRLFFWAGHNYASVEFTIWNPGAARHPGGLWDLGDEGSQFFKGLSLELFMMPGDNCYSHYCTDPTGDITSAGDICIYQDSSGGENCRSRNHVNRNGQIPISFRGYRIYQSGQSIADGLRATPIMALTNGRNAVSATVRNFWENFPSSIETCHSGLKIGLFPIYFNDLFELQGGEQKTHGIYLNFSGNGLDLYSLAWCHRPLVIHIPAKWYCSSGVFPYVIPRGDIPDQFPYQESYELVETAIKGEDTFFGRREIVDEYGWRNFGDVYADHENLLYKGEKPIVSHYNNQYDLINSFLKQYVRSGEEDWFMLAGQLAQHVMDIDIYHTDKDRYEYNKGLFWHTAHYTDAATSTHRAYPRQTAIGHFSNPGYSQAGGPSYSHVYSQGLLSYYFLTGDQKAKEAVIDLATYVSRGIDGPDNPLGFLKHIAKNIVSWAKHHLRTNDITPYGFLDGPGRASGNALSVLLDAYQLTKQREYLLKAEYLLKRCIHPRDDLLKRKLSDVNNRWMYTIFLQSLGKYLDVKAELPEFDYMYFYARESLLHYAKWMLDNEVPFLSRPELIDFPNLATRAATDIRKANVLILAAKHSQEFLKSHHLEKARFFFENSIRDLLSDETRTWTRPLAILMQNVDLPLYSATYPNEKYHQINTLYNFGSPSIARSIGFIVGRTIKVLKKLAKP